MAIFKVIKDGVEEIIAQESSAFIYKPDGKTKSYAVQRVMYKQNPGCHQHLLILEIKNI